MLSKMLSKSLQRSTVAIKGEEIVRKEILKCNRTWKDADGTTIRMQNLVEMLNVTEGCIIPLFHLNEN